MVFFTLNMEGSGSHSIECKETEAKRLFEFVQGKTKEDVAHRIGQASKSVNASFDAKLNDLSDLFASLAISQNSDNLTTPTKQKTTPLDPSKTLKEQLSLASKARQEKKGQDHLSTFFADLDQLMAYVDAHYRCFMVMVSLCADTTFQQWCVEALMNQSFYHSLPLARLIIEAQCLVDTIALKENNVDACAEKVEYSCPVCCELLHRPVVLSCAHCVCHGCITHLVDRCPVCEKVQPIKTQATQYAPNDTLQSFLDQFFERESKHQETTMFDEQPLTQPLEAAPLNGQSPIMTKHLHLNSVPTAPNCYVRGVSALRQILELAEPGSFVALDIDETLQVSRDYPSMLMTDGGIALYQEAVTTGPFSSCERGLLSERRCQLQAALYAKKLLEHDTLEVIQQLQAKGCWVFGLTSRYSEMAAHTHAVLSGLGVNLAARAPFPLNKILRDPQTAAVCQDGIIYTNAINKALILDRFLSNVVFRDIDLASNVRPPKIIFVDDRLENVEHMAMGLPCAAQLNIPIHSCHFVPDCLPKEQPFQEHIASKQVYHFLCYGDVLTDDKALDLLQADDNELEKVRSDSDLSESDFKIV